MSEVGSQRNSRFTNPLSHPANPLSLRERARVRAQARVRVDIHPSAGAAAEGGTWGAY